MGSQVHIHSTGVLNLLPSDKDVSVGSKSLSPRIMCLTLSGEGAGWSVGMGIE